MQALGSLCLEVHVHPRKKNILGVMLKSTVNSPALLLLLSHLFEKQLLEISFTCHVATIFQNFITSV